jgi:hypothetical protein
VVSLNSRPARHLALPKAERSDIFFAEIISLGTSRMRDSTGTSARPLRICHPKICEGEPPNDDLPCSNKERVAVVRNGGSCTDLSSVAAALWAASCVRASSTVSHSEGATE